MNQVTEIIASRQPTSDAVSASRAAPGRMPREEPVPIDTLIRFKALMAVDGHTVQLARLCDDRHYAYERIALAHASASTGLRALALELFHVYHRRGEAGLPAQ